MGEMKERYEESLSLLEKLESMTPKKIEAWYGFAESLKEGVLSEKISLLIALALATVKGCEACIIHYTRAVIEAGATKEEILEACWIAVKMDGGPGLANLGFVLKVIEEFAE